MRLSSARINYISHLVSDYIEDNSSIECFRDKNDIRLRIKIIITDSMKLDEDVDKEVKRMIGSMSKSPPEGSKEWEVLYEKYYNEELNRRGTRQDNMRRIH